MSKHFSLFLTITLPTKSCEVLYHLRFLIPPQTFNSCIKKTRKNTNECKSYRYLVWDFGPFGFSIHFFHFSFFSTSPLIIPPLNFDVPCWFYYILLALFSVQFFTNSFCTYLMPLVPLAQNTAANSSQLLFPNSFRTVPSPVPAFLLPHLVTSSLTHSASSHFSFFIIDSLIFISPSCFLWLPFLLKYSLRRQWKKSQNLMETAC